MKDLFPIEGNGAVVRDMRGDLKAAQRIMLSDSVYLEVLTRKGFSGRLVTAARVWIIENGNATTRMYQDYSKTLLTREKRATAKAIEAQQADGLVMAQDLALSVYNQYVSSGEIQIPVEQSLAAQVQDGGGDAWVEAAKSGQVMRIM
jgi:hypothetical protein